MLLKRGDTQMRRSKRSKRPSKKVDSESKGIAMVILGIVAIIAIVGLVLLFVRIRGASGMGIYGGAIKGIEYPYWQGRGVPAGGLEDDFDTLRQASTHWNWEGQPKRSPYQEGDVPSLQTACPGGIRVSYGSDGLMTYYESRGFTCYDTYGYQPGKCCYPPGAMVDAFVGYGGPPAVR